MRAGTAFQHIRNFRNWPTLAVQRARHIGPAILRLRSGEAIRLMDGNAEFWAYQSIYCEHCYDRDFPGLQKDGTVIDLGGLLAVSQGGNSGS
jgi:hypothetical protein